MNNQVRTKKDIYNNKVLNKNPANILPHCKKYILPNPEGQKLMDMDDFYESEEALGESNRETWGGSTAFKGGNIHTWG